VARVAAAFLLVVLTGLQPACDDTGEQGGRCKYTSWTSGPTCDEGLVCNEGGGNSVCEKPKQHGLGEACSSDLNCAEPLWCAPGRNCAMPLQEGQPCPGGVGCAAGLTCHKDLANMTVTCRRSPP